MDHTRPSSPAQTRRCELCGRPLGPLRTRYCTFCLTKMELSGETQTPASDRVRSSIRSLSLAVMVMAALDAAATIWGYRLGLIREANPYLRGLLEWSPVAMFLAVIAVTSLALAAVRWAVPRRPEFRWVIWVIIGVRVGVLLMHLAWMVRLLPD